MKKEKDLFWIENGCFAIMGVTFLFMPVRNTVINRITGILFWLSLLAGIICQRQLSKAVYREKRGKGKEKGLRPGVLYVAQNPIALVADMLLAVCVLALIIAMAITEQRGYSCFIFIALLAFSFSMHCIWNGRNCEYLFGLKKKYRKRREKERIK